MGASLDPNVDSDRLQILIAPRRVHQCVPDGVPRIAIGLEAGAAALGFAMITLMVRHGFHPEGMDRDGFTLYEWSTYAA